MRINVKNEDIKTFDKSETGKIKNYYFKRIKITGIICIIIGLSWLILNIYYKTAIYDYILAITLNCFGIFFIINSIRLKKKEINKFIYENKKSSKKWRFFIFFIL